MAESTYDPFAVGPFAVGVRTQQIHDRARARVFPCEIWYPAQGPTGPLPLVVFSHQAGGNRRSSTFLCSHLASHGYVVAAVDHSEIVDPALALVPGESESGRAVRLQNIIAGRVPDVVLLLDHLLTAGTDTAGTQLDAQRIAVVGHSFGGWTALAMPEVDQRVGAVVAIAPGGAAQPKPGILPLTLTFDWGRDVPTLYLAAELDVPIAVEGVHELFTRTPASTRMFVLKRSDHQHFVDDVAGEHEAMRAMPFTGDAAWLPAAMLPITELCSAEAAHTFTRGLTLAHLDSSLRRDAAAQRFLAGDVEAQLTSRGAQAYRADLQHARPAG